MHEGPPKRKANPAESPEIIKKRERISLAKELHESHETFPFPGLRSEVYARLKARDEEFPGYTTPIDELVARFENEGMKVVLGKNPESGNILSFPL